MQDLPSHVSPPMRPTNQMAMISIGAGVASFLIAPFAGSIVAIACGHIARRQIRETGEDGDGLAVAGLVLGYAHLALFCVVAIVVCVVFFGVFGFAAYAGSGQLEQPY